MALSKLSGDEQGIVFIQLCNVLDPGVAVALSSVSNELRTATQGLLPQLRADHEVATALCLKVGLRSCKELREAKEVDWCCKGLTAADLTTLGTLGSVLPALKTLYLVEPAAGPDGVQRLAEGLGAGALPAVTTLQIFGMHVGDSGASALAAALGQRAGRRRKTGARATSPASPMAALPRTRILSHGRAPCPRAVASAEAPASPTCIPLIER